MFNRFTVHNHFHFNLPENFMSKYEEILAKIETIAIGNTAEISAELADVKTALVANAAADDETKMTVKEHQIIIETLVDKLGASQPVVPAPLEPQPEA